MRFSHERLTALAVVAVTLCCTQGAVSRSALSAPQRWIRPHKGAFGLVQQVSRGGNTDSANGDTKEAGEEVELYLPGLLEASIPKSKKVCVFVAFVVCVTGMFVLVICVAQTCLLHSSHNNTAHGSQRFHNYPVSFQSKRTIFQRG